MPQEVNICVRTLDKNFKPLPCGWGFCVLIRFEMNNKINLYFLILLLCIASIGCSGSSPRFKSKESQTRQTTPPPKEFRFSYEEVKKQEQAEDDQKVDVSAVKEKINTPEEVTTPQVVRRDKILTEVLSLVGTPYAYSGNDENGIDCSGFTCKVYEKSMGIKLPRSTDEQYKVGKDISRDNLGFGDLVFFNTTGKNPSHVGIYIGDDLFAHASLSFGVTISSLQSSYYHKRYVGARRIAE
jgi:cell wall-associated NlpC family hydrolase